MHRLHPVEAMYREALQLDSVFFPEGGAIMNSMGRSKTRLHAKELSTADATFVSWSASYAANVGLRCALSDVLCPSLLSVYDSVTHV